MQIYLESVFNNPGEKLDFAFALQNDMFNFVQPAQIAGQAVNQSGIVTLRGSMQVHLKLQCDRCAEAMEYKADVPFAHTMVTTRESEESDELILVENFHYDPEPLLWEDIVLAMPPKMLCRPDCKGLCLHCGRNLNEGACSCKPMADPRWEALQTMLDSGN